MWFMNKQKIQDQQLFIIDGQLIGCLLYIASLAISIIIILDQRKKALNKEGFLTTSESQTIALLNKIFILALILLFLYLNYKAKILSDQTGQDSSSLEKQIIASFISLIPALIGLYVVFTDFSNTNLQTAEIENPFA